MNDSFTKSSSYDSALAHLFYAMTMADRTMDRDEKLQLTVYLQKNWSKSATATHADAQLTKTLKELIAQNIEAQKAFLVFSEFFYRNKKLFDASLKSKINTTCEAICAKKGKRTKTELIFASKLSSFFNPSEDLMPLSYQYDED